MSDQANLLAASNFVLKHISTIEAESTTADEIGESKAALSIAFTQLFSLPEDNEINFFDSFDVTFTIMRTMFPDSAFSVRYLVQENKYICVVHNKKPELCSSKTSRSGPIAMLHAAFYMLNLLGKRKR